MHSFISLARLSRALFPHRLLRPSSPPPIVSTHHKNGDTDIVANGVVRFPRFPEFPLPPPDFVDMSSFRFVSSPRERDEHDSIASRVSFASRVRSRSPTRGRSISSRWRLGRVSRGGVSRARGRAARSDERVGGHRRRDARDAGTRRRRDRDGRMDAWRDAWTSMDVCVTNVWTIGGGVDGFRVYPRRSASRAATPRPSSKSRACSRTLLETSSAVVFLP